jgi:glutamyl-tRNA synthetase
MDNVTRLWKRARMTVTRFAPSPTGHLHIGNLRAALFNWAIARQAGGTFILRLDDTDPDRSTEAFADAIREDLSWLGLNWDRSERQSARLDRYAAAADSMRGAGRLYEAFETPGELDLKRKKQLNMGRPPVYDRAALDLGDDERARLRADRAPHWRFLLDRQRIDWTDGILGPISIDAGSVSDPVLIRGDGQVLYTLASVVDDVEMGVTDVVRGSDHVTNTATQIQIIAALGGTAPRFAHHSLLTGPGGEALSKRLGTLSLRDLRARGVEPMAVLSLMARLGSSRPVELFADHDALLAGFDIASFGSAPTKFDPADLMPLTAHVLAARPFVDVAERIVALGVPEALAPRFWDVVRDNIATLDDLAGWWDVCAGRAVATVGPADSEFATQALGMLGDPPYDTDTWARWTGAVGRATGRKGRALFMPLRQAVTGRSRGPEMADVMPLLQARPRVVAAAGAEDGHADG